MNAKHGSPKTGNRKTTKRSTTLAWLKQVDRRGVRRIEQLSWGRLGRTYYAKDATVAVRKAIAAEARRCGYDLHAILGLNSWK